MDSNSASPPEGPPTLAELRARIVRCQRCVLSKARTNAVPGEGDPHARVMLVGEAPGFYEDQHGRPFVGPAGQFLDELLQAAGLRRAEVFITNVIKCRPPGNRDPEPDELEACDSYLREQIAAISPRVIVTLGRFSLAKFVPQVKSMKEVHGRAIPYQGMTVVAMYHPAAALHQGSLRRVIEEDFRMLPMILDRAEAERSPANGRQGPGVSAGPGEARSGPEALQMSLFE